MLTFIAHCKNCKSNWRLGEDIDLPPEIAESTSELLLHTTTVTCPTDICEGRQIPIMALDLDSEKKLIGCSPQDSSGNSIKAGDLVRYRGESYYIERTGIGKDENNAPLVKLFGLEEPVIEWSVDLKQSN